MLDDPKSNSSRSRVVPPELPGEHDNVLISSCNFAHDIVPPLLIFWPCFVWLTAASLALYLHVFCLLLTSFSGLDSIARIARLGNNVSLPLLVRLLIL